MIVATVHLADYHRSMNREFEVTLINFVTYCKMYSYVDKWMNNILME
jgi:hypothetical protein